MLEIISNMPSNNLTKSILGYTEFIITNMNNDWAKIEPSLGLSNILSGEKNFKKTILEKIKTDEYENDVTNNLLIEKITLMLNAFDGNMACSLIKTLLIHYDSKKQEKEYTFFLNTLGVLELTIAAHTKGSGLAQEVKGYLAEEILNEDFVRLADNKKLEEALIDEKQKKWKDFISTQVKSHRVNCVKKIGCSVLGPQLMAQLGKFKAHQLDTQPQGVLQEAKPSNFNSASMSTPSSSRQVKKMTTPALTNRTHSKAQKENTFTPRGTSQVLSRLGTFMPRNPTPRPGVQTQKSGVSSSSVKHENRWR
jgi:hypothetical protein